LIRFNTVIAKIQICPTENDVISSSNVAHWFLWLKVKVLE